MAGLISALRRATAGSVLVACSSGLPGNDPPLFGESSGSGATDPTTPITASSTISTTESESTSTADSSGTSTTDASGSSDGSTSTGEECSTMWRTDVPGVLVEEAALGPDDRVFAAGNDTAEGAVLLGFDRCTGEPTDTIDVDLEGAAITRVSDLVVDGGAIYLSGSVVQGMDPGNGYFTRVEGTPLATVFAAPLFGSDDADEVTDIAIGSTGRIWMSGIARIDVPPPSVWGIASEPTGDACGFPWGAEGDGTAHAVVRNAGGIRLLVVTSAGAIVVLTYADDDCLCGCTPASVSGPVAVGTASSAIAAAVVIDDQIYVAGWASDAADPDDVYAALVWLDADGELVDVYRENATAADDGYLQLASDGQQVFVAGIDGYTGGGLETGTARLDALPVPLPNGATPDWSGAPMNLDFIAGVAVEAGGDGGLFLAGNAAGEGVIVRCDKTGACG